MNGMFGPYIEKWMRFITVKNMLLLAVVSAIITDLGLYILTLIFPKSPFFKTFIWEVISPIELEVVPLVGYVLGIVAFALYPPDSNRWSFVILYTTYDQAIIAYYDHYRL